MDNKQQAALDAMNRVKALVSQDKYASYFDAIDDFDVEETHLDDAIERMMNSGVVQTGKDNSDEKAVKNIKHIMAETAIQFAMRGKVKAQRLGNISLANALDEPETYIEKASKTESILRAQTLTDVMNNNLTTLTNISTDDVKTMQDSIDAYSKIKEDPVSDRKERKAMGTDVIPQAEKEGKLAMDNMYALASSYLSKKHPELVNLLGLAKELTNTAVRHTTVIITTVREEDNEPIEAAPILDEKTGKQFATDDEGLAELGKHISGDDTFVISAPGRQTVTLGVKVISRKENEFLVKMRKE